MDEGIENSLPLHKDMETFTFIGLKPEKKRNFTWKLTSALLINLQRFLLLF